MGKDFSPPISKTIPTERRPGLNGETKIVPSGNVKGDFMVNLSIEKSFLRYQ